jgi:hypothetical protein
MRRLAVLSIALLTVSLVAGCGRPAEVTFSQGVIHVPASNDLTSLTKSVLGIRIGTTESKVRERLGEPFRKFDDGRLTCWAYHADQAGSSTSETAPSSLEGIDFCMSAGHRVARIELSWHL